MKISVEKLCALRPAITYKMQPGLFITCLMA